ncbi:MAG TPA: toprim domain-containing protein [Longimicrobium sp.]
MMDIDTLPLPTETELLAASGYPYLPVRVRHSLPPSWNPVRDGEVVARYTYTGEEGEARFECMRFHRRPDQPGTPDKAFLSRRADGAGGWAWGLDGVQLVPYRLSRLRRAVAAGERVFVVEGEKDVHALEEIGLTATCNPLGSLQWTELHAEVLRGADVVVIPDNDRAGMVHAGRVMATLRGRARSAALLLLQDAAEREDVSDWLARGNGAAELQRLADAAPRDPSAEALAALLRLPRGVDPLAASPEALRALLIGVPPGAESTPPPPHPGFRRAVAAFARLGVAVRPSSAPAPPDAGVPEAHPTWRAIIRAARNADAEAAALLEDASLPDRAAYELGLFAGLLRAAAAEAPAAAPPDAGAPDTAFATAPLVRVVRTRWDWDAFLNDAALPAPPESGAAYLLHLPPAGPLQMRRLQTLPAILLEVCARPCTRAQAAAAVAERVDADAERLAAAVRAQMDEMRASGLLRPTAPAAAEQAVDEMLRLLRADQVPQGGARSVAGMLSRSIAATRELADRAAAAEDDAPYPRYLLDVSVDVLQDLLGRARLRGAFAAELDACWAGADVPSRLGHLIPLLDVLGRAVGRGAHALPPYVLAS